MLYSFENFIYIPAMNTADRNIFYLYFYASLMNILRVTNRTVTQCADWKLISAAEQVEFIHSLERRGPEENKTGRARGCGLPVALSLFGKCFRSAEQH